MKTVYEYGSPASSSVLIQMVDDHDLDVIDNEVSLLQSLSGKDFHLLAVKVDCWNHDLSPWNAPAVFGSEAFGDGAEATLSEVLELMKDSEKNYYVGRIFPCRSLCTLGCISDRCLQRRCSRISFCVVSGFSGLCESE